jgi:hypothetical protein
MPCSPTQPRHPSSSGPSPASRLLPVDGLLDPADLLPFRAVVQAMDDAGRIAEERALDAGDSDDVHDPALRLPG